jgi:hypothetical protein
MAGREGVGASGGIGTEGLRGRGEKDLERGGEGGMDISLFGTHIMSFLLFTLRAPKVLETPGAGWYCILAKGNWV